MVKLTMRQIRKELGVVDQYHNPTLTLTFCHWTVVESGEGQVGSCPGTDIDPEWQSFKFAPLEIW